MFFPKTPGLLELLGEAGISCDGDLLIKRTISREGRNRVFINGSVATLQTLSRLGPMLISISGQYAHQLLLRPENHLYLLDDYSGLEDERVELATLFDRYHALKAEIASLEGEIRAQKEREELARFQIQEIEMAGPHPGRGRSVGRREAASSTRRGASGDCIQWIPDPVRKPGFRSFVRGPVCQGTG